jgi:hypothetical protein
MSYAWAARTLLCLCAPFVEMATDSPGLMLGAWVADMKGNVGATRDVAEFLNNRGNPSVSCARDAMPARRLGDRAR